MPGLRAIRDTEKLVRDLLASVGLELNGARPEDIRIRDDRFFKSALANGLTGVRDAYVNGWWDTDRLDVVTHKVLECGFTVHFAGRLKLLFASLRSRLSNLQRPGRSSQVRRHYDLGDDLFSKMLDRRKVYSCAYWEGKGTLDEAQEAKLDLVCRKVHLKAGMRVLDIGCGWGSFAKYAAERYGASVLGVTISCNQARLGTESCWGLPVEIRLQDYRKLADCGENFDAIVSLGMFEHVGYKNYLRFMQLVRNLLKSGGLFLLQTIGSNVSQISYDPWMNTHIFPNAHLPSVKQVCEAAEGLFLLEDVQNFGPDYDRTLLAWHENFERAWPCLCDHYGEHFRRLWNCYLLTCAGSFRARENQLWQFVFGFPRREEKYAWAR